VANGCGLSARRWFVSRAHGALSLGGRVRGFAASLLWPQTGRLASLDGYFVPPELRRRARHRA
jgi:hypothetical protein